MTDQLRHPSQSSCASFFFVFRGGGFLFSRYGKREKRKFRGNPSGYGLKRLAPHSMTVPMNTSLPVGGCLRLVRDLWLSRLLASLVILDVIDGLIPCVRPPPLCSRPRLLSPRASSSGQRGYCIKRQFAGLLIPSASCPAFFFMGRDHEKAMVISRRFLR